MPCHLTSTSDTTPLTMKRLSHKSRQALSCLTPSMELYHLHHLWSLTFFRLPADKLLISILLCITLNANVRFLDQISNYYLFIAITASIPHASILSPSGVAQWEPYMTTQRSFLYHRRGTPETWICKPMYKLPSPLQREGGKSGLIVYVGPLEREEEVSWFLSLLKVNKCLIPKGK